MAESKPTPRERTEARFFTASGGTPPSAEQKTEVEVLRGLVCALGLEIEASVPNGRNKSLALKALEDVQMRANRAIFEPGAEWPETFQGVEPHATPISQGEAPRQQWARPGLVAHYCLSEADAERINRRRDDAIEHRSHPEGITPKGTGYVAHTGNVARPGDYFPLVLIKVWPGGLVSGQVMLDGNDTLWVTSIHEGSTEGTWTQPPPA